MIRNTRRAVRSSFDLSKSKEYVTQAQLIVREEFNNIKNTLLDKFDNHAVTREIKGGINASNISNTLGGKGNLFSFIGFESNDSPTEPIRDLLESKTRLTNISVRRDGSLNTFVLYPKKAEIFLVTPMPWARGRSWAEGIEKGISGLGYYLNKTTTYSRSGKGLQSKNSVRTLTFSTTPYIGELIRWFEGEIIKLNRKTIL